MVAELQKLVRMLRLTARVFKNNRPCAFWHSCSGNYTKDISGNLFRYKTKNCPLIL